MVKTEPLEVGDISRTIIESNSKNEDYSVRDVDDSKIVLVGVSKHDLDLLHDILMDKAAKEQSDYHNFETDVFNRWLNNRYTDISDEKISDVAKELKQTAYNIDEVDVVGEELPYNDSVDIRLRSVSVDISEDLKDLSDEKAIKEVKEGLRGVHSIEVSIDEDYNVELEIISDS
jgi:hypothetical protein